MFKSVAPLLVASLILGVPSVAMAEKEIRTEQVQFDRGATSKVIEEAIQGYDIVDYVLNARAGQLMNVSMASDNTANYFNIIAPGETDVAIFNSSVSGNQFEQTLPKSGNYKIRVYLMRSAARRDEIANYRLEMIISALNQSSRPDANGVASRVFPLAQTRKWAP